jgi:hypothetical protein
MKKIFGLLFCMFLIVELYAQRNIPVSKTIFNLAAPRDSIEYIPIGRGNNVNTVEAQVFFSGLDCNDFKLAVGKSMLNKTSTQEGGGIFPESFGELSNPVTLDTTAVDSNGNLMFRKYYATGPDIWNFNIKFIDWNSYYLVFVIDDYGSCTEGIIKIVK